MQDIIRMVHPKNERFVIRILCQFNKLIINILLNSLIILQHNVIIKINI